MVPSEQYNRPKGCGPISGRLRWNDGCPQRTCNRRSFRSAKAYRKKGEENLGIPPIHTVMLRFVDTRPQFHLADARTAKRADESD